MSIEDRIRRLEEAMNPQGNPLLLKFMVIVYLAHEEGLLTDAQHEALSAGLSHLPRVQLPKEETRQTIRRAVAAFLDAMKSGRDGGIKVMKEVWEELVDLPFPPGFESTEESV